MRRKRREAAGEAEGRNDPNCKASCFAGKQASISGNAVSPLGGDHAAAVPRCRGGQIIRPTLYCDRDLRLPTRVQEGVCIVGFEWKAKKTSRGGTAEAAAARKKTLRCVEAHCLGLCNLCLGRDCQGGGRKRSGGG